MFERVCWKREAVRDGQVCGVAGSSERGCEGRGVVSECHCAYVKKRRTPRTRLPQRETEARRKGERRGAYPRWPGENVVGWWVGGGGGGGAESRLSLRFTGAPKRKKNRREITHECYREKQSSTRTHPSAEFIHEVTESGERTRERRSSNRSETTAPGRFKTKAKRAKL